MADRSVVQPMQRILEQLRERYSTLDEGDVATYIPELAKADPDWFGIASHHRRPSIPSANATPVHDPVDLEAVVYGLALEDNGVTRRC